MMVIYKIYSENCKSRNDGIILIENSGLRLKRLFKCCHMGLLYLRRGKFAR